ncbi:uncharacterized protein LOC123865063 isoform X4 [Maniola jurtina]|uniref:uncharacterized protein LOC123865063 isoform X4 n=1 Tax=Maniola jurtina TaxID=191418 RepID=UPI001E68B5D0|nr:uncharacterized protein LOC123865063 isoform X4 [Maniola jurtina]
MKLKNPITWSTLVDLRWFLSGGCSGRNMSQSGLKHVATEPTRLESKRERRRGAAGRAAALRRAPSDSDCSGETASLSADSGDRSVRPAPPPPRSGKSRSRRRGSEWEVLEGLKDGQRFEKRPEVFNGYLHKKRKWPLKGWHKRFFVVDGGILVYARSPTDVARGRLHGSVDVGLSVISAKARRRRIDIDADEFIYHLRAKTPDVFRTWLNVLKAHRLYRQHLLTFGARESVPKIHAPLEDLPPTDTSSHTSDLNNLESSLEIIQNPWEVPETLAYPVFTFPPRLHDFTPKCNYLPNINEAQTPIKAWIYNTKDNQLIPMTYNPFEDQYFTSETHKSLCSMNYVQETYEEIVTKNFENKSLDTSRRTTDAEKQIHSTDLESNFNLPDHKSFLLSEYSLNSPDRKLYSLTNVNEHTLRDMEFKNIKNNSINEKESQVIENTQTVLFFCHKNRAICNPIIRKSKKSTNLVKYKNLLDEPPLDKPLNKFMILGKYKGPRAIDIENIGEYEAPIKHLNIQVKVHNTEHKGLQNTLAASEYDAIAEKLMVSIFENFRSSSELNRNVTIKTYVNQIVKELYDIKLERSNVHPVKNLFRCLLEYWLNNTSSADFKQINKMTKSIERQSNHFFAKDETTSKSVIASVTKAVQFYGISNMSKEKAKKSDDRDIKYRVKKYKLPYKVNNSFEVERRIQELERILRNTVYVCETVRSTHNREDDIKITKTLIDNLDKLSHEKTAEQSNQGNPFQNSNSSNELPDMQETIDHRISETSIPPDFAKEFLAAYLDLLHENENNRDSDSTTEDVQIDKCGPKSDVQAESIQKKVSISISTKNVMNENIKQNTEQLIDPGQLYLKNFLDQITATFSIDGKNKTINQNPVSKNPHIELNIDDCYVTDSNKIFNSYPIDSYSDIQNPFIDIDNYGTNGKRQLHPYKSSIDSYDDNIRFHHIELNPSLSDGTSKAYRPDTPFIDTKAYHAFNDDVSFEQVDQNTMQNNSIIVDEGPKSVYIMCLKRAALTSNFESKRNHIKRNRNTAHSPEEGPSCSSPREYQEDRPILEKIPKLIDEQFILQLLGNVCALSKNLPTLHKDINSLYLKLYRKHEKLLMNCKKVQGVGLLGKIYNDDTNMKNTEDNETQFVESICPVMIANAVNNTTNTSSYMIEKNANDIAVKECAVTNRLLDKCTQIDFSPNINGTKYTVDLLNMFCTNSTQTDTFSSLCSDTLIKTKKRATLNCKPTRDCAIGTEPAVKSFFDKISSKSFRFWNSDIQDRTKKIINFDKEIKADPINKKAKKERKPPPKVREELIKEITLLSSSFNMNTQSQTDIKRRWLKEKTRQDYNVYQFFMGQNYYKPKRSYSMQNATSSLKLEDSDDLKTIFRCSSEPSYCSGLISPASPLRGPQAGFVSGTPGGRLAGWSIESGGPLDSVSRELGQAQLSLQQLQGYLDALELHQQTHHDTDVSLEGASPNVKKDRRKFGLRKKKSSNKCASAELAPPHMDPSNSHMALSALTAPPSPGGGASSIPASAASLPIVFLSNFLASTLVPCAATRPQSLPGAEALNAPASLCSLTPDQQLREDFTVLAKDLVCSLKNVVATLVRERGRARAESEGTPLLTALRTDLSSALQQNSVCHAELRSRLTRIHDASDLAELSSMGHNSPPNRPFQHSLSYSSSCVSASEFFDAEEHEENHKQNQILDADEAGVIELDGDSTSEAGSLSSEDGSASSDNSDAAKQSTLRLNEHGPHSWVRRTRLPHPRPSPGGPSLWNLLYKNIGKDLSQISMPVTINEPLNMLQRLCEELEYSELLDAAAKSVDAVERCALVAAFAVSAYAAAANRAASKPFNPLLAETYECVRADRAFRFIAEQVSHHPPISACHAESPRWVFWQEARIKTKFWGKSMEFQPAGRVHVKLLTTGDHYSWNKVTTCVHNLFGGQRWVDQYGDMHITCHGTDIGCKLNFIKASSWSSSRHEVRGAVTEGGSGTRLRLAGRWSEALYAGDPPAARCLWRPGAMPPEHELYYGFTRFAMELNEMEPGMRDVLPHTDTRLRPDQRALEEGDVESAEQFKHQLEQSQRERRRDCPEHAPAWFRRVLEGSEEMWSFTGEYWKAREAGFPALQAPRLW